MRRKFLHRLLSTQLTIGTGTFLSRLNTGCCVSRGAVAAALVFLRNVHPSVFSGYLSVVFSCNTSTLSAAHRPTDDALCHVLTTCSGPRLVRDFSFPWEPRLSNDETRTIGWRLWSTDGTSLGEETSSVRRNPPETLRHDGIHASQRRAVRSGVCCKSAATVPWRRRSTISDPHTLDHII